MNAHEVAEAMKSHWGRPVTGTLKNGRQVTGILRGASLQMPEMEIRPGEFVPDPPAEGTVRIGDDEFDIEDLASIQ